MTAIRIETDSTSAPFPSASLTSDAGGLDSSVTVTAGSDIRGSVGGASAYQRPELNIYDATGRVVKSFILSTAYYILPTVISWNGIDDANRRLPSGVYFIKFEVGDWSITEKVILVR